MSVLMLFRRKVDPDPSTLSRADARLTDVRGAAIDSEKSYSHTSSVFSRPLCLRYGDIYDLICESGAAVHGLMSRTSASVRPHAKPYQCRACIDGVETKSAIVDRVTLVLYRNSGISSQSQPARRVLPAALHADSSSTDQTRSTPDASLIPRTSPYASHQPPPARSATTRSYLGSMQPTAPTGDTCK